MEARGSEFDLRREYFFYKVKYRVEYTFFWNKTILLNDIPLNKYFIPTLISIYGSSLLRQAVRRAYSRMYKLGVRL